MSRTALSLCIEDEELYKNLINPYKQNKQLTNLVMSLLTKYYYDEEFRAYFDKSEVSEEEACVNSYDEYFRDINAYMAVMSNMTDTMEATVKNGLQDIINSAEQRTDVSEDWGATVPRVSQKFIEVQNEVKEAEKVVHEPVQNTVQDDKIQQLENKVDMLVNLLMQGNMNVGSVQKNLEELSATDNSTTSHINVTPINSIESLNNQQNISKVEPKIEPEMPTQVNDNDFEGITFGLENGFETKPKEPENTGEKKGACSSLKKLKKSIQVG